MKLTIQTYLIKEQIVPLIVAVLGLTFILITGRVLQLARYLFASSLSMIDLLQIMAFTIPTLILFALPMATLVGVLLAFVRLNSDSELISFRAAGVSFKQFMPAVLSIALLTTATAYLNMLYVVPLANKNFEDKIKSLGSASLPALLKEGTFIDIIPNLVFFFNNVDTSDLSINGVFVQDQRRPDLRVAIVAESARIFFNRSLNQLTFKIMNGTITRIPDNLKDAQSVAFRQYDLRLPLDELFGMSSKYKTKNRREMSLSELYKQMNTEEGNKNRAIALEFHQRLALPPSCLLLALVAAPLGALFRQRNRMGGITLGLGIYLLYYVVLSASKGFAKNGLIAPSLASWLPNFCAAALAMYLWFKVQRESPFGVAVVWKRLKSVLHGSAHPTTPSRKDCST